MAEEEKNEEITEEKVDEDLSSAVASYGRCTYLLVSLVALIVISPFGSDSKTGEMLLIFLRATTYVFGIYVISENRRILFFITGIACITVFLEMASLVGNSRFLYNLSIVASTLVYMYVTKHILRYILTRGPITADKLHGAMAIFITLAFLWTGLYVLLENLQPGSFSFATEIKVGDPWRYYDLLFFSFSTLTTTGYGDITPRSPFTHMLSVLEQLFGVFFVAVLIARLAGGYTSKIPIETTRRSKHSRRRERSSKLRKRS